ncbi:MAG: hypothetical protein LC634_11550, partial [Sphingomonadales bacterium]|nr:hypothetical protein [Sphingomonadales bacterium]
SEPEVVNGMYDPTDELAAEEANTEVPPMVRASRSYRCADNSVVYVTFYTNDAQVGVAAERNAPPTILRNDALAAADAPADTEADTGEETADAAEDANGPISFSGNGNTLVGTGDRITYNGQTCNG